MLLQATWEINMQSVSVQSSLAEVSPCEPLGVYKLFLRGQIVNIDFANHMVSAATTKLCCHSRKAATDNA